MKPGHGEVLIAEGDVEVAEDEERLIEEFRRQLDAGLWAAVPVAGPHGRREAQMVQLVRGHPPGRRARDLLPARGGRPLGRGVAVLLALAATALVALALLSDLIIPRLEESWRRMRAPAQAGPDAWSTTRGASAAPSSARGRCCARASNEEEWAMYRDLGFIRVWGTQADGPDGSGARPAGAPYAYLIYPHRPIVAYLAQTHRLLGEYCVAFPDETRPYGSARLPDSDDVLAKWMALTGDERRLIATANMHLPGRQLDPEQVRARPVAAGAVGARRMRQAAETAPSRADAAG